MKLVKNDSEFSDPLKSINHREHRENTIIIKQKTENGGITKKVG